MNTSAIFLSSRTFNCNVREAWLQWTNPAWLRIFFGSEPAPELIECPFEIYAEQSGTGIVRLLPGKLLAFALPVLQHHADNQVLVTFSQHDEQLTTVVIHRLADSADPGKEALQALHRFTDWFESFFCEAQLMTSEKICRGSEN